MASTPTPDVSGIYGGAWQGPVFVLTHHPEDTKPAKGVTFLSCDVAEAVRIGLEAAGGKNLEIFSPTIGPTAPRARTDRQDRPAYRTGAARRRIPPFRQPGGTRGWMGLKCRRSSVATFGHSESFSSCDEACGSFPKWEVGVLLNELCHALGVSGVEIDKDQFSRCE
jgi:hypothetical protein